MKSNRQAVVILCDYFRTGKVEAGDKILNVQGLTYTLEGETLFKDIDLNMAKGDKVVVSSKDSRATTAFYGIFKRQLKSRQRYFRMGNSTTTQSYFTGR